MARDEKSDTIKVTGHTALIPRDNARKEPITKTVTLTVEGEISNEWPDGGELSGVSIAGVTLMGIDPEVLTYNVALPAGTKVTKSNVKVQTSGSPDVAVKVANASGGYTVTITVDADGAPKVYTITATVPAA